MTIGLPEIPGYQLEREIGAGGMARVYLATQTSLDRKVALKVMAPALVADPAFSKRFLREARTLAGLTHPNIVAVYDVGATESQLHYFAMQHLDNSDLAARIARGIPETDLVRIVTAIAKALGFAHVRGVVHRDVTPGNIMFDSANNPVLTDFGIARSQHGSTRITHTGVSIGTSSYMSPEQARGGDVDQRSDLYSLGALCFEALTGHPPYQGADGFAVAYAHVFEPIPRLPTFVSHWQPFIDKVLSKDPNERFENADQFAMALSDVPVSANRIVPQRVLSKATLNIPVTSAGPQGASTRPLTSLDERALAPIKKSLGVNEKNNNLPAKAPSPAAYVGKTTQSQNPSVEQSRRSLLPFVIGGVLAIALGVGGWLWLHQKPTKGQVIAANPSTKEVAPVVNLPNKEPTQIETTSDDASDTGLPQAQSNIPIADVSTDPNGLALPMADGAEGVMDPLPLASAFGPPTRAVYVKPWVDGAISQAKKNLCFAPRNGAVDLFRLALSIDTANALAIKGVADCFDTLVPKVDTFLASQSLDLKVFLPELDLIQKSAAAGGLKSKELALVQAQRTRLVEALLARAQPLENEWNGAEAAKVYESVLAIDPNNVSAKAGIVSAPAIGRPGFRFSDPLSSGGKAPAMIVIGSGEVTMRDAKNASVRVKIADSFAVARTEVTYGDFSRFLKSSGYRGSTEGCNDIESFSMFVKRDRTWNAPGFDQTDRSPVVCVDFNDAQAYVRWLSKQTKESYRLLSEAEWQLLAKAAPNPGCKSGNIGDSMFGSVFKKRKFYECNDGHAATAPVGSFGADRLGLVDVTGNVREWVADCWNASISGHPNNGGPWQSGRCGARVAMGTSWISINDENSALIRNSFDQNARNNTVGFRVARDVLQVP